MGESWASSPGRRRNMQAIRSRDTAPEIAVRRLLHAMGPRYRVHYKPIPTLNRRADIVFTRQKVAVFIDGCFWHGCPEHGSSSFRENPEYWSHKIRTNVERDRETDTVLESHGWRILRLWTHSDPVSMAQIIALTVRSIDSGLRDIVSGVCSCEPPLD
jgi:DNA mismatch endonuclease (patch repair protein)